jgi:hypothetical protein
VIAREYDPDGVRYYYLVNIYTDRWSAGLANDPGVAGDNSTFTELYTPRAEKARLRIPGQAAWDVFGNREYRADADGSIAVTLGPDDGMLLALYPQGPARLTLKAPGKVKPGDEVALEITVRGAEGKALAGSGEAGAEVTVG